VFVTFGGKTQICGGGVCPQSSMVTCLVRVTLWLGSFPVLLVQAMSSFVREPRGVHKIAYYCTKINSMWILCLHLDQNPSNI